MMDPNIRIRLITVMWGQSFVDSFCRYTIPSLLTDQNIPYISRSFPSTYTILTTAKDADILKRNASFKILENFIKINLNIFSLREIEASNSSSHWILWNRFLASAKAKDEVIITIAPDHLFSNNTLTIWCEFFTKGFDALFTPGIQVCKETIETHLDPLFNGNDISLNVTEEMLNRLLFEHLHPLMMSMFRNSPRWMKHPEYVFYGTPGIGFVQRIFASHAVAFRPARIKVDSDFRPQDGLDRIAFDKCRFLSIEPLIKHAGHFMRAWKMDDAHLSHTGAWAVEFTTPANLLESKIQLTYLLPGIPNTNLARGLLVDSQAYRTQLILSKAITQIWNYIRKGNAFIAAEILATAHLGFKLRRRIILKDPFTVFVPQDSSLARYVSAIGSDLFKQKGSELLEIIKDHVAHGKLTISPGSRLRELEHGEICMISGKHLAIDSIGKITVIRQLDSTDFATIYLISGALFTKVGQHDIGLASCLKQSGSHLYKRIYNIFSHQIRLMRRILNKHPFFLHVARKFRQKVKKIYSRNHLCFSGTLGESENSNELCDLAAHHTIVALLEICKNYNGSVLNGSDLECYPMILCKNLLESIAIDSIDLEKTLNINASTEKLLLIAYYLMDTHRQDEAIIAFSTLHQNNHKSITTNYWPEQLSLRVSANLELMSNSPKALNNPLLACKSANESRTPWEYFLHDAKLQQHDKPAHAKLILFDKAMVPDGINPSLPTRVKITINNYLGKILGGTN